MIPRREFITLLGGATGAWPVVARAERAPHRWRIGMLETISREQNERNVTAFTTGMREFGQQEGDHFDIYYRFVQGRYETFPALASELIGQGPDVIVVRTTPAALALKRATTTLPIVMSAVADPVGVGIVASLSRPGGNITGLSSFHSELEAKRVEILKELLPSINHVATIKNFGNPTTSQQWEDIRSAANLLKIEATALDVRAVADLQGAFEEAVKRKIDALIVSTGATTQASQRMIVELAARHKLPAIYTEREFVDDGGLMSYGVSYARLYFQAARFVDRILKGSRPADLPIEQPTKMELVINLKTAKALGLTIPEAFLLRADEVIE